MLKSMQKMLTPGKLMFSGWRVVVGGGGVRETLVLAKKKSTILFRIIIRKSPCTIETRRISPNVAVTSLLL